MITFNDISKCLNTDLKGKFCIEIEFCIDGCEQFYECWMGKMPNQCTNEDVFWFGLTPDSKNAYNYSDFKHMSSDKVFQGSSLEEIWDKVTVLSIDGCNPKERIKHYL